MSGNGGEGGEVTRWYELWDGEVVGWMALWWNAVRGMRENAEGGIACGIWRPGSLPSRVPCARLHAHSLSLLIVFQLKIVIDPHNMWPRPLLGVSVILTDLSPQKVLTKSTGQVDCCQVD